MLSQNGQSNERPLPSSEDLLLYPLLAKEDQCYTRRVSQKRYLLELITFEILAAERLRLMGFDNRLIIDCFANVVNILIWLFSTNDRFRSEKYESNYLENPFPEMKGVNLLSKTHRNDKSNLKPKTVLQE